MRPLILFPLLGAIVHAQTTTSPSATSTCQCPLVKCDATDSVTYCNCLNSRESICKSHCPAYIPTYHPCPVVTSTSTPAVGFDIVVVTNTTSSEPTPVYPPPIPTPSCICEARMCMDMWPASCYCNNNNKLACYQKCGGPMPPIQSCPPQTQEQQFHDFDVPPPPSSSPSPSSSLSTSTYTPRRTRKPSPPTPTGTHAPCGGGRGGPYLACPDASSICIKDPYKPGCGPECDGLGICVEDRMCGGFPGFPCPERGMACVDDVRYDCDAEHAGADCTGLCVWPH